MPSYRGRPLVVDGAEVDRIARSIGARKIGERRRTRPFDPDAAYVDLGNGRKVTMRAWADAMAEHHSDQTRARRFLLQKRSRQMNLVERE
jgi:hypothetical protein